MFGCITPSAITRPFGDKHGIFYGNLNFRALLRLNFGIAKILNEKQISDQCVNPQKAKMPYIAIAGLEVHSSVTYAPVNSITCVESEV